MKLRDAACLALLIPLASIAALDAAQGRKLVDSHKCEACHEKKIDGPAGTVYLRSDRRVASWAKLKSQVALCNSELNIGLFPEDEEDIAAFLNATYYKLPEK
ncbi:MAG: hypothetical protein IPP91_02180 [Betaproteobacteria bacterium]|nr:hypothetical protein [Betaproteobacteria bacterium]